MIPTAAPVIVSDISDAADVQIRSIADTYPCDDIKKLTLCALISWCTLTSYTIFLLLLCCPFFSK